MKNNRMVKWVKALAIKPNNQFDTQDPLVEWENWLPPAIWVQSQHKLHETLSSPPPQKTNKTKNHMEILELKNTVINI